MKQYTVSLIICVNIIGYLRDNDIMELLQHHDLTFEELCEVVAPIAIKHGINRIYLFGSRARGDNQINSDYDFCLAVPADYDLFDLGSILSDLEEALGTKVDIVCEDNLKEESYITQEIYRDRRIIFEV